MRGVGSSSSSSSSSIWMGLSKENLMTVLPVVSLSSSPRATLVIWTSAWGITGSGFPGCKAKLLMKNEDKLSRTTRRYIPKTDCDRHWGCCSSGESARMLKKSFVSTSTRFVNLANAEAPLKTRWTHIYTNSDETRFTMVSFLDIDEKSLRWQRAQSNVLRPYLAAVRSTLTAALTLENFSSQVINSLYSHNSSLTSITGCRTAQQTGSWDRVYPSSHLTLPVWLNSCRTSKEVLLNPLTISRNENERVLIESSVNSIRLSIKIKQADEIERILCHKFTRFMMQRAESFIVLRRKPVQVLDLLCDTRKIADAYTGLWHLVPHHKHAYRDHAQAQNCWFYHPVAFAGLHRSHILTLCDRFMEEVDKEISEMKLSLNARARIVAESYLTAVCPCLFVCRDSSSSISPR